MARGAGHVLSTLPVEGTADQWRYVIYGSLGLLLAATAIWLIVRHIALSRGESSANESRARKLLDHIAEERRLRVSTHWRACPNGTMRWEVDVIDERTGQRWVKTDRRLLEATRALAKELEFEVV